MRRLPFLLIVCMLCVPAPALAARAWQPALKLSGEADTFWQDADVGGDGRVGATWLEGDYNTSNLWVAVQPGLAATLLDADGSRGVTAVAGNGEVLFLWQRRASDSGLPHAMVAIWNPTSGLGGATDLGELAHGYDLSADADTAGNMVVAYTSGSRLVTAFRPAGGTFGPVAEVSPAQGGVSGRVALGAGGAATFAWTSQQGSGPVTYEVWGASRVGSAAVTGAQKLSADGLSSFGARVATDALGRGIVTWLERPAERFDGWVRAAARAADGAWSAVTGLDGYSMDPPDVDADADGDVLVTWKHFTPSPDGGGQGGPLRIASGSLATAAFQPSANLYPLQHPSDGVNVGVGDDGSAILAWEDFSTREVRTSRRSGTGAFGDVQTVRCPAPAGSVLATDLASDGTGTVVFRRSDSTPAVRPLFVTRDAESPTPSAASCPATDRKPYPIYNPYSPAPGQTVTIDVEGTRHPDATSTTWQWDMDNDGVFETDTGTSPIHTYAWPTAGFKTWKLQMTNGFARGFGGTSGWNFQIQVSTPYAWTPPPAGRPAAPPAPPGPDLTAVVGARQRLRSALAKGLAASLKARVGGAVTAELWIDAKEARRLKLGRKATRIGKSAFALAAGKAADVRVRFAKKTARKLSRARRLKLALVVLREGKRLVTLPVTLK